MDAGSLYLSKYLIERIQPKADALADTLLSGRAQDHAHYKHIAGQIDAYNNIIKWIQEFSEADPGIKI